MARRCWSRAESRRLQCGPPPLLTCPKAQALLLRITWECGVRPPGRRSDVRVAMRLGLGARVGDGAVAGGADRLGVFPQRAGLEVVPARPPALAPPRELRFGEV